MGNVNEVSGTQIQKDILKKLYEHTAKVHKGLVTGGADELEIKSISSLSEYGTSLFSKSKEDLIRKLAKSIAPFIGIKDSVGSRSIDEIVKALAKAVPKPGSNKTIHDDKQAKLCMKLAESLNAEYGDIIDLEGEPKYICQKVGEIIYSLFTGIHNEFLTVAGDVQRVLKNLDILQEIVHSANRSLIEELNACGEAGSARAENVQRIYSVVDKEINRQRAILANLVNASIGPANESILNILDSNPDFKKLVADISETVGTKQFGDRLTMLLYGIYDVSHTAKVVNDALKEVGISVKEYAAASSPSEINKLVMDALKSSKGDINEKKMIAALKLIKSGNMSHEDIVSKLNGVVGGDLHGVVGGDLLGVNTDPSFTDDVDDRLWRDDIESPFSGRTQAHRTSLGHSFREQEKFRNQLFNSLNVQFKSHYSNIVLAIERISQKVGTEISPSPDLERFVRLLVSFANTQPDKRNLHLALTGNRTDPLSTFTKYQYLEYLELIRDEALALSSSSGGAVYFKDLANSINKLILLIDDFNKTFMKTLSKLTVFEGPRVQKSGGELGGEFGGAKKKKVQPKKKSVAEHADNVINMEEESSIDSVAENVEPEVESVNEVVEADVEEEKVVVGGEVSDILGGIISKISSDKFKHFASLQRAIKVMDYYIRIANVKKNISVLSEENKLNTDNYENILGEEAGFIIDSINKRASAIELSAHGKPQDLKTTGYTDEKDLFSKKYKFAGGGNDDTYYTDSLKTIFDFKDAKGNNVGKDYLEGYRFVIEYIRSAKVEMLEAAQALDIYLSNFTKNIEKDPDTIKDFIQIIEPIELVAKFFTDASGDHLAGVFEAFSKNTIPAGAIAANPNSIDYSLTDFVPNVGTAMDTEADYIAYLGQTNHPLDGSAFSVKSEHYYADVAKKSTGLFMRPRLMKKKEAIEFIKQIEKAVKTVRSLENIVSLFSKINPENSGSKTFMTAGMIFKAFTKYCVASVIGVGYKVLQAEVSAAGQKLNKTSNTIEFPGIIAKAAAPANNVRACLMRTGISLRVTNEAIRLNDTHFVKFEDPLYIDTDVDYGSVCDNIFEMCIKSMVTKIFVMVGSFDLFHRPVRGTNVFDTPNPSFATHPLRQILGGADADGGEDDVIGGEYVDVDPSALELYIRLPLMVEWYRNVFEFNKIDPNNVIEKPKTHKDYQTQGDPLISIIPEMSNIWRDLCFYIFIEGRNINEGGYTSHLASKIIRAITDIYKHYKGKKSSITCKEIIEEFILEINRRYGFMMRAEINRYFEMRDRLYQIDSSVYDNEDNVDFDILDSKDQFGHRPAPSDKFRTFSSFKQRSRKEWRIFYAAVRRFRHSVEQNLLLSNLAGGHSSVEEDLSLQKEPAPLSITNVDLDEIIRITKQKVEQAKTPEERFRLIHDQLHGIDRFADLDQNKLLLYHETVITPLTLLYFIYLILNNYNKYMVSCNLEHFRDCVEKYLFDNINNFNNAINTGAEGKLLDVDCKTIAPTAYAVGGASIRGQYRQLLAAYLLDKNCEKFRGNAKSVYGYSDMKEFLVNPDHNVLCGFEGQMSALFLDHADIKNFEINSIAGPLNLDVDTLTNEGKHRIQNKSELIEMFSRFILNREGIMKNILENLMMLSCNLSGLVEVYFPNEGASARHPSVSFDRIRDLCVSLFQQVKQSITGMRKHLPSSIISRIEKHSKDEPNPVSLVFLQEHLFDRLFNNKYGNGLDDANNGLRYIWSELTREHKFNYIEHIPASDRLKACLITKGDGKTHNFKEAGWGDATYDQAASIRIGAGGAVVTYSKYILPISEDEYKANPNKVENLLREYCFDSYNHVISQLLFWDVDYKHMATAVSTQIVTTEKIKEFPFSHIPIFNNKQTASNPSIKSVKDQRIPLMQVSAQLDPNAFNVKMLSDFDTSIATIAITNAGGPTNYNLYVGCQNLYNFDIHRSFETDHKYSYFLYDGKEAKSAYMNSIKFFESLLLKFNSLLYRYFKNFIDPANKRIYKGLIDKFVMGYNSKDIIQGKNINDKTIHLNDFRDFNNNDRVHLYAAGGYAGNTSYQTSTTYFEPPEQATILASLASAIKTVYTATADKITGSLPLFLEENFANISEYQKELMRAYLPAFEKELEMIIKRSEFIKLVIEQTQCKVYKNFVVNDALMTAAGPLFNANTGALDMKKIKYFDTQYSREYTQPLKKPVVESESTRKSYLLNITSDLISSCKSLLGCINNVQKELADIPIYFETYKDSIVDYNNRNKRLPLMPLSSITNLMNMSIHMLDAQSNPSPQPDNTLVAYNNFKHRIFLIPHNDSIGSVEFKFAYGTRGLLNYDQKPLLDYMPGVAELFNTTKVGGGTLSTKSSPMVSDIVNAMRYLIDYMYFGAYLSGHKYTHMIRLLATNQIALFRNTRKARLANFPCQTGRYSDDNESADRSFWSNPLNVAMLAENDNYKQSLYRLVACLRRGQSSTLYSQNRNTMRIFNILDLNVVPINFHAMQREIPFVNLINYSYTYDHLVKETLGVEFKRKALLDIHGFPPVNPNDIDDYDETHLVKTYTNKEFEGTVHPEDQMVRHLIYPYGFRRIREYLSHVYKIMAGDTSLSLNRPKYISDQLWNKVLLNNLYDKRSGSTALELNQSRKTAEINVKTISSHEPYINYPDAIKFKVMWNTLWQHSLPGNGEIKASLAASRPWNVNNLPGGFINTDWPGNLDRVACPITLNPDTFVEREILNHIMADAPYDAKSYNEFRYSSLYATINRVNTIAPATAFPMGAGVNDVSLLSQFAGNEKIFHDAGYDNNAANNIPLNDESFGNINDGGPNTNVSQASPFLTLHQDKDLWHIKSYISLNEINSIRTIIGNAATPNTLLARLAARVLAAGGDVNTATRANDHCNGILSALNVFEGKNGKKPLAMFGILGIACFLCIDGHYLASNGHRDAANNGNLTAYPDIMRDFSELREIAAHIYVRELITILRSKNYTPLSIAVSEIIDKFQNVNITPYTVGVGGLAPQGAGNYVRYRIACCVMVLNQIIDLKREYSYRSYEDCLLGFQSYLTPALNDYKQNNAGLRLLIPFHPSLEALVAGASIRSYNNILLAYPQLLQSDVGDGKTVQQMLGDANYLEIGTAATNFAIDRGGVVSMDAASLGDPAKYSTFEAVVDTAVLAATYPMDVGNRLKKIIKKLAELIEQNNKSNLFNVVDPDAYTRSITTSRGTLDDSEPLIRGIASAKKSEFAISPLANSLSYVKSTGSRAQVQNSGIPQDKVNSFAMEGYYRYNTRLVRNLEWFCQNQRLVRILMRNHLEWVQDPVVQSHDALAESTTEYKSDNKGYLLSDFE